MIRRPPTIITVGEEDIQHVMDSMSLTSFSKDFEKLNLEDQGKGSNGSPALDHSPSYSAASSSGPDEDGNVNPNRGQAPGSFCTGNHFTAPTHGLVMGPTNPMRNHPSVTAQSAHPVGTVNVPATTLLGSSTPFPLQPTHPPPGRQAGTWFTLPIEPDVETGTTRPDEKQGPCNLAEEDDHY